MEKPEICFGVDSDRGKVFALIKKSDVSVYDT